MLRTGFDPSENGFHFSNNDVEWQLLLPFIRGKNVCGGMCYGALDYLYGRMRPPSMKDPPKLGTVLNDYLLDRQLSAHGFAIPLVAKAVLFQDWNTVFDNSVVEEIPKIKASIQAGKPIPLLLIRDHMLECHFVLVIACDMWPARSSWQMKVYDPNQPDAIVDFTVTPATNTITLGGDGHVTYGFFADTSYRTDVPPVIPEPAPPAPIPFALSAYCVAEGDTLRGLALRFYGWETRWVDIYEANRSTVGRDRPRGLKAGQLLTIPD